MLGVLLFFFVFLGGGGILSVCMFLCLLPCQGVLCFGGGCFWGLLVACGLFGGACGGLFWGFGVVFACFLGLFFGIMVLGAFLGI